MPNPLQLIPASVRRWIYMVYGAASLVVSMAAGYFTTLGQEVPDVVVGAGGALVPLGLALAAVAASNTTETNTAVVEAPASVDILPGEPAGEPPL